MVTRPLTRREIVDTTNIALPGNADKGGTITVIEDKDRRDKTNQLSIRGIHQDWINVATPGG